MVKRMQAFIRKLSLSHWSLFKIILLGIVLRLLVAMFFTHTSDSFSIIALSKSVADTGNLIDGFSKLGGQLYGKLYFQIIALWMTLLNQLHFIHLGYIFDIKAYAPSRIDYLGGFPGLGPQIYQLFLIKSIQFVYDIPLLYFLIKIVRLLKPSGEKAIALFWAINPFFIYIGYVIFQSDLAMVSLLTGGVYFTIKSLQKKEKGISKDAIFALFFFAFGAVIKQVPLLVFPFALFLFSDTIWLGIFYTIVFAFTYAIGYQPWSIDTLLIKKYFLTSPESTALFNFSFNGLTIFFFLYFSALGYFTFIKNKIKSSPLLFIKFVLLIIAVIYVSEDIGAFFIQFSIWIMPFIAIISLENSLYSIFLFISLLGFYSRVLADNSILSGSLAVAFGQAFRQLPSYNEIIKKFIEPEIVAKLIQTLFTMLSGALIIYIIYSFHKKFPEGLRKKIIEKFHLSLVKTSFLILLIFLGIGLVEFFFMTHNALLTNYVYKGTAVRNSLSTKEIHITIANKAKESLTGIRIKMLPLQVQHNSNIIMIARDNTTKKILTTSTTSDFQLPNETNYVSLYFNHAISAQNIDLVIKKDNGANEIAVFQTNNYALGDIGYPLYDGYYNHNAVLLKFPKEIIDMNLIGEYSFTNMFQNFLYEAARKPIVFIGYFGVIGICIVILLTPFSRFIKKFLGIIA